MALSDGTPGSDGVLVTGQYDPRFDIETDEFKPFGFIYLLTNKINGKQYVGQTTKTTADRWYEHVKEARSYKASNGTRKKTHIIDAAIAKYGEENFTVEEIECCLLEVINAREIYWIQKHDCCLLDGKEKGYNISRGGRGFKRYLLDEKEIARLYYDGLSASELAKQFNTSSSTIRAVLVKNGYELRSQDEVWELQRVSYGQTVKQMDDDKNVLREFASQAHAADWIIEQGLSSVSSKSVRVNIKTAFFTGRRAYGFYWDIDGIDEDEYEKQVTKYTQSRLRSDEKQRLKTQAKKTNICAYDGCTKAILPESTYCNKHALKISAQNQPSRCPEDINEVIKIVCDSSFEGAGRHYGVDGNSVRKWFKTRGIPFHSEELVEYAISKGIIDDPIDSYPHEDIYRRVIEHGGLQTTSKLFHCSKSVVIKCCLKHGMSLEDIETCNNEARARNVPKRVAQCDCEGNIVTIFDTIGEASRATGVARIQITEECKGHRKTHRHWKFLD